MREGETLYRISLYYGVPVVVIAEENGVDDPTQLQIGKGLLISGAQRKQPRFRALRPSDVSGAKAPRTAARGTGKVKFRWPLKGRVSSPYGRRWGRLHEGVDVAAKSGTKIRSAAKGRVLHAGWLGAYGRVVIVQHRDGFSTVYAHNRKNLVRKGERVKQGEVLALVGATGRATGPHLHFEIRRNERALDPLQYLK